MPALSRSDEKYLASLVRKVRPEWDEPGLIAAFRRISEYEKPPEFVDYAIGALQYAAARKPDGTWKWDNPGSMQAIGEHWGETAVAERKAPPLCIDHNRPRPCPPCQEREKQVSRDRNHIHNLVTKGKQAGRREAELERNTP